MNDKNIEEFIQAYKTCALWSSMDETDPETGGEPIDANHDIDDIAADTAAEMEEDCRNFLDMAKHLIEAAEPRATGDGGSKWGLAGHDFWLTRNGHGAGFWDGDWPDDGRDLTKMAKSFGSMDLYVGDDGLVYSM